LTHTDSLTAKIKSRCRQFEVKVLFEGRTMLTPLESRLLGVRGPWRAREVLLLADGHPVVWARTAVAIQALQGPWYFLRGLGSKPLGARLFSDPRIVRSQFVFVGHYRLSQRAKVSSNLDFMPGPYPARIARLTRQTEPALLTEVLLPHLINLESF